MFATVKNRPERAKARRMVRLVCEWLRTDPRISPEEIRSRFAAIGCGPKPHNVGYYLARAKVLLNRELLFGSDAEPMFTARGSR